VITAIKVLAIAKLIGKKKNSDVMAKAKISRDLGGMGM
jgi:hypothetical protein